MTVMRPILLLAALGLLAPGPSALAGARPFVLSIGLPNVRGGECAVPDARAKATVLIFIAHDCPIANGYAPEIERTADAYAPRGVAFDLVYVEPGLTAAGARAHEAAYGCHLAAVRDTRHVLVKMTGAMVTPEAVVLLPDGKIAYRGRIDDKYPALGQQRTVITQHDLRNALDAILAGKPVPKPSGSPVGCFIPPLD